ncbi:hypothetical protein L195_g013259 [Trifolium pratense]|uniref:Uncharacterized protein n=1 Tax=Trifolium pratense TaxID=57577 RepID=A0A2K3PMM6_TRIPR|nr:hypothetical protein L195_g013259 [Trifolium pratense]
MSPVVVQGVALALRTTHFQICNTEYESFPIRRSSGRLGLYSLVRIWLTAPPQSGVVVLIVVHGGSGCCIALIYDFSRSIEICSFLVIGATSVSSSQNLVAVVCSVWFRSSSLRWFRFSWLEKAVYACCVLS